MATENSSYDPLRNPQVDFDRTDLSPRGILLFLIGLLLCGAFIELVVWGMFRFMAKSDVLFPQAQTNPMASSQPAPPQSTSRSIFQNAPGVSLGVFPEPRLQVNDAADMSKFLYSEDELLNPPQPFKDSTGAIHIPISQAMKVIEERGLPVRPNAPAGGRNEERGSTLDEERRSRMPASQQGMRDNSRLDFGSGVEGPKNERRRRGTA